MSAAIAPAEASTCSADWAVTSPLDECRAAIHRSAFRLTHGLTRNPLFTVEALVELAKARPDVYMDAGNVSVTDKWGKIPMPDMPAWQVINRIETSGAWIIMKGVEADPRYRPVLEEFATFVRETVGADCAKLLRKPEMLILITSPNRITPFHFDAEVNFLVQVHGSKDVWICDPADRTITTEAEIERYYAWTITAGTYKPHAEERAAKFVLHPGEAVHIPTHAAHWVKNHDNVSVSLSLNFEFPSWLQADVFRTNYYLRKLGVSPRPPGRSLLADRTKAPIGFMLRKGKLTAGKVYRSTKRIVGRMLPKK